MRKICSRLKKRYWLTANATVFAILILNSCLRLPPGFDPPAGVQDFHICKISQVNFADVASTHVQWIKISYNSSGDPLQVDPSVIGKHSPRLNFQYDATHRVTALTENYGNESRHYGLLHRYVYDSKSRICTDLQDYFGLDNADGLSLTVHISYDSQNRVSCDSAIYANGQTAFIHRYQYNDDGNLSNFAHAGYDDKIGLHRLNRVWMFVDRNYSLNNPLPAVNYNTYWLPVAFSFDKGTGAAMFLGYGITHAAIEYDCK